MENELKSCTGVLLRADLTGHGHSSPFCQNRWDGRALLGQPSKGHPCRILILFPYCSTISLAPHIKKLETYFALLYFWTFAQCAVSWFFTCYCLKMASKIANNSKFTNELEIFTNWTVDGTQYTFHENWL